MRKAIIVGAGGHAKVLADILLDCPDIQLLGFSDAQKPVGTKVYRNLEVITEQKDLHLWKEKVDFFVMGIGNIQIRKKLVENLGELQWLSVVHQSATISPSVKLERGVVVLANATLCADAVVKEFSIIDSNVVVDHECQIGAYCHLTLGTLVGSNSILPELTKTSLGQIVQPFTTI